VKQIPAQVAASLGKNVEYLTVLVAAYSDAGRTEDAAAALKKVSALLSEGKADLPAPAQLQLAGVFLKQGRSAEALDMYQRVAAMSPENVIAWEGLLAALIQAHKEQDAYTAMQRMPQDTYAAALRRSGFLHSAALIHAKFGNLATAEALLDKVLKQESADGPQLSTQLLLANVWVDQGHGDKAGSLLRQLIRSHPQEPEVWKSYISALHQAKRDSEALAVGRQIPVSMQDKLENDTDFIGLLAAVSNDAGDYKEAVRLVRSMVARLEAEKQPVPADLLVQLAWLMLDAQEGERALYTVLNSLEARQDLTADQRQRSSEIWSMWTRRRAESARHGGDLARSAEILEAASRVWPNDMPMRSALAGVLVEAGQTRRALDLFKRWKLAGGTSADYAAAIGAAFAERDPIAPVWIQAGLQRWPSDAKLLSLAGQHAAAKGDVKKAEMYWRVALAAMNQSEKNGGNAVEGTRRRIAESGGAVRQDDPKRSLGRLLVGDSELPAPAGTPAVTNPVRSPQRTLSLPRVTPSERARPDAAVDAPTRISYMGISERIDDSDLPAPVQHEEPVQRTPGAARFPSAAELAELQSSTAPVRPSDSRDTPVEIQRAYRALQGESFAVSREPEAVSERDGLERKLAALEGRNTPYMGTTGTFQTRNGQKGFEQRTLQEVEMTASTTLFDRVRFTAIARPSYISTGAPDEGSELRLGLLPQGSAFASMTASGLGGEGQISTENFGIRFGASPQGFLVKNYIGGFRFRPAGGPITLLASRDMIKDTILSYAGVRDPISKQVWGGVVANTFSVLGNWGDEQSGFYFSGGFQTIRGMQVLPNRRIDANAGTYWKVLTRPEGSLTIGLNLTAMSYDKNLRFFTLGHGGYFSPQKYFLMNVPARWTGRYKQKFIYGVNASAGTQYVQEDAAPYFPTLPGIQGRTGPTYAAQTLTGANFNLEALGMYEVAPGWYVGAMVNANNARYYTARNASIFLRHAFGNKQVSGKLGQPSVPDWRGTQPFMLP
jgi:tetratricopeptide (TPR) repeat protein